MKRTESALRETEAKIRVLYETMPQGVIFMNQAGQIVEVNSAAERIFGHAAELIKQRDPLTLFGKAIHEGGSDFPGGEQPAMTALTTGRAVYDVVMGVQSAKNEGITWIRVNAVPQFRTGETKPYQVYMSIDDNTTSKTSQ